MINCKKGHLYNNNEFRQCPICKKAWFDSNKEYRKSYFLTIRDKRLATSAKWNATNKERKAKWGYEWRKNNPEKNAKKTAKYLAARKLRTPNWLIKSDWTEIRWAYAIAKQKTKETGILHHVDHIVPLQGDCVSGLHCPQNLQIIPASENKSKGRVYAPY